MNNKNTHYQKNEKNKTASTKQLSWSEKSKQILRTSTK